MEGRGGPAQVESKDFVLQRFTNQTSNNPAVLMHPTYNIPNKNITQQVNVNGGDPNASSLDPAIIKRARNAQ